jgi:N6-L-threonylcarbamoyladenine synthase
VLEAGGGALDPTIRDTLALALQEAIAASLANRTARAIERIASEGRRVSTLVVAGGVAANGRVREALAELARRKGLALVAPPARLCTDNAAMIAWAGIERLRAGAKDELGEAARPRWPLDPAAPKALGAGVKA